MRLENTQCIILTCYHVVASLSDNAEVKIDLFSHLDAFVDRIIAHYDPERSEPNADLAVLSCRLTDQRLPVPFVSLSRKFSGPRRVIGITRALSGSQRFEGLISDGTPLVITAPRFRGSIPFVFRLIQATDVRPGISGSPIILDGAVVGLNSFLSGR